MQKFAFICLCICVVSDVLAEDDTHYSTYEWMKATLSKMMFRLNFDNDPDSHQVPTVCADKWITFGSSCYLFVTDNPMDFLQAERFCEENDAHLVSISSQSERMFIYGYANQFKAVNFWIGLTDAMNEGVWQWIDTNEDVEISDWIDDESQGGGTTENCVIIDGLNNYRWNDVPCTNRYRTICEQ